jgi:putative transposase
VALKNSSRFAGQLRWLHKVRLYPTCAQERALLEMLKVTRELYNALLQQRRDAWTSRRESVPAKRQYAEIAELRAAEPRFARVYRECEDAVLHRLDLAFAAFFRRLKAGEDDPGYPRFKPASRWNQIEFPHGDRACTLDALQRRVKVPGVGAVRLRKGRVVPPGFGRVFVVTKNGCWYAVFEAHRDSAAAPGTGQKVRRDRGVRVLAALSDGTTIENERPGSKRKAIVERHARKLDAVTVKDAKGRPTNGRDPMRVAAVRRLARAKEREANARRDWLHKVSRKIVDRFDVIALEDLNLRGMTRLAKGTINEPGRNVAAKSGLNREMLDAGLGMLGTLIREKAAYAVRRIVGVDARYSSQTCAQCGQVATESREGARLQCIGCGHANDADVNAERVILLRAESPPTRAPGRTRGTQQDAA